jgi:hypothetical protein
LKNKENTRELIEVHPIRSILPLNNHDRRDRVNQQHLSKTGQQLKKIFCEQKLNKLGKAIRFSHRDRIITPYRLALTFMEVLSCSKVDSIADIQRGFNGLFGLHVQYKPFHNQLAKAGFAELMRQLFIQMLEQLACRALAFDKGSPFARFHRIELQDGTSFAVHRALSKSYPGRFHTVSPAAVELHVTLDLLTESVGQVVLTADTEAEAQFLPVPESLTGSLVMADRGYFKKDYLAQLMDNEASFIIKGKATMNPTVTRVVTTDGKDIKAWRGQALKALKGKLRKNGPMDMDIHWQQGGELIPCRLIVTWNPDTRAYQYLVTNLLRDEFTVTDIIEAYRLRWQIELLFKEWKSYANLAVFNTTKEHILDGLIWASLCAATLKRFFAHRTQKLTKKSISTRKVAMCFRYFLTDIFRALIHHPRKFNARLKAAIFYLEHNAKRDNLKRDNENGRAKLGLHHDFSFA